MGATCVESHSSSLNLIRLTIASYLCRFLKNVYTVFRAGDSPTVGFAELADNLQSASSFSEMVAWTLYIVFSILFFLSFDEIPRKLRGNGLVAKRSHTVDTTRIAPFVSYFHFTIMLGRRIMYRC